MSVIYKEHTIEPFMQFRGAWLASYRGPVIGGMVSGFTERQAIARAKLAVLQAIRSQLERPAALRRYGTRSFEETQKLWIARRNRNRLPPPHRVKCGYV